MSTENSVKCGEPYGLNESPKGSGIATVGDFTATVQEVKHYTRSFAGYTGMTAGPATLYRGTITSPEIGCKKWSLHWRWRESDFHGTFDEMDTPEKVIHVELKDWRKRADAPQIREAIWEAYLSTLPAKSPEDYQVADDDEIPF
jgi:hypothetical protein